MDRILPFGFQSPPIKYINNLDSYFSAIEAGDERLLRKLMEQEEIHDFMENHMGTLEECRRVYIFNFVRCYFLAVGKGVSEYDIYPYTSYFVDFSNTETNMEIIRNKMIEVMFFFAGQIRLAGSQKTGPLVQSAVDYIDKNLERSITITELAEHCRVSASSLSHHFKRELGVAPIEYVNRKKIERACFLLRHSGKTCSEIAQALGFCSQSYFGKQFRQVMGVTPKCYRDAQI